MTFQEKLRKLAGQVNKADAGRKAGLGPTTISNYLAKGSMPRLDIASKIARALGVSLEWLADDSQGWPPTPASPMTAASTEQLAVELGRRLAASVGVPLLSRIFKAQETDWIAVARELLRADPDAPMPKKLHDLMELPGQINAFASELRHFDPHVAIGDDVPSELVKKVLPGYELSLLDLWTFRRNLDDRPGYSQVLNLSALFGPVHYRPAWFPEIVRRTREHVAAELAELEQHERLHPASNHLPAAPKSVQAKPRRRVRRG